MKLFILLLIVLNNSIEIFGTQQNNEIETLYIDKLVQDYMSLESHLWNHIYNSGGKSKDIIYKIRADHNVFLSTAGLSDVMNDYYKLKFGNFLNVSVFDNYVHEDPMVLALIDQPHGIIGSESYVKSDMLTTIYNSIISNNSFEVIKEVSFFQLLLIITLQLSVWLFS